jgi:chromosome partitioning protein
MPYILGCVSQKGGVGKSTIARGVAVALTKQGYKVRLADLDTAQGTSVEWYRRRLNGGGEPLESVEYYKTAREALEKSRDVEVLVVDAQGRSSESTLALAHAAHVIVQPASGSLDDLDPAIRLYNELRKNQISPKKLLMALLQTHNENEETLAKDYIDQAGFPCLRNTLPSRLGYKVAQNSGLSIVDTTYPALNERAGSFLDELFFYIKNLYVKDMP